MRRSIAAVIVGLALAPLGAQQRAPQNDSIRQEDLRADLFFVAGDSLRGRLTDTEENRATADFIRSRFERMGLKPAGPGNSYFQPYNLMTATLGASPAVNALEVSSGDGATRELRVGQEFYPQRFSASGARDRRRGLRGLRHQRAAARLRRLQRRREGPIVLALDHEPGERDPNSPFDGVVTSESSTRVAQGARGAGEGRRRGALRHATFTTTPARRTSNRRRATTGPTSRRASSPTRSPRGPIGSAFRWRRCRRRSPRRSSPAPDKTLEDLAKAAETARGFTPLALPGTG